MSSVSDPKHGSQCGTCWLQALCFFTGKACLTCDRMDVSAICQYVADTLKQAESYDLLVLRSIVEDMTVSLSDCLAQAYPKRRTLTSAVHSTS